MAFTRVRGSGITTTDNYIVGVITATKFVGQGGGIATFDNVSIGGSLTVDGDFTTLNTTLREVELLQVDANSSTAAGIITQRGSGDILNLYDGSSQVFTVRDGGKVGIGTYAPVGKYLTVGPLQETGTDRASLSIKTVSNSLNNGEAAIQIEEASGTEGYFLGVDSSGGLSFTNSGASHKTLYLSDTDKVGIGTDNPGTPLEIKGTATTLLRLDSSNAQGTSFRIRNSGSDKMYMGLAADFITGQSGNVTDSAIRASGALLFSSGGGTEKLRITSAGNVGINESSPDSKLHISGGSNENVTLKIDPGATAGNYSELVIGRTSGAPTIQTTPAVKAGIPISGVPGILLGSENTNLPCVAIQTPNSSNGHIVFKPKGSERLRIDANGKIGVGVQPNAWQSSTTSKVIQIGNSSVWDYNLQQFDLGQNFYYDGADYHYIADGYAT